jgi:hypothetical protein
VENLHERRGNGFYVFLLVFRDTYVSMAQSTPSSGT